MAAPANDPNNPIYSNVNASNPQWLAAVQQGQNPDDFTAPQQRTQYNAAAPAQRLNASSVQSTSSGTLKFQMPDGSVQSIPVSPSDLSGSAQNNPQLWAAIQGGGTPVDAQGKPMQTVGAQGSVHGGTLYQGSDGKPTSLYQMAGFDDGQHGSPAGAVANAVQSYLQNPNSPLSPAQAALVPGYQPPAPGGTTTRPGSTGNPGTGSGSTTTSASGLIGNIDNPNLPLIPGIDLGPVPQIPGSLPQSVIDQTGDISKQVSDAIHGQGALGLAAMPQAQAAQTQLGQVPQVTPTQLGLSDQIQQMLTGKLGYNPDILAKMKANAQEGAAQMGQSEMSQAQRALEQSGLGGGGVSGAVSQDIARQTGQAASQASNQIDVQNAQAALGNFQQGVGYQQQTNVDNFQMANQMALENANKLFQSIQQNTQNQQQVNTQNASAGQNLINQTYGQAGAFDASAGNMLNNANLSQAQNALLGNTQNQINQQLNQAQLNRQQQITNLGAQQNQWQTGNTLLSGFAPMNQFNPQQSFSPLGATASSVGASLLNQGNQRNNNTLGLGQSL